MKKPNTITGFSLVELMVVIGVIGIMAAIATPSLLSWLPNVRFRDASRGMLEDVQFTKMSAIKRNANVAATFLADGSGYTIFVDDGAGGGGANDNILNGAELTIRTNNMPTNVVISAAAPALPLAQVPVLAFLPTGLPANGAALVYAYNNQTNHNATLTVSVAGSIKNQ